jgi:hypothetical protein
MSAWEIAYRARRADEIIAARPDISAFMRDLGNELPKEIVIDIAARNQTRFAKMKAALVELFRIIDERNDITPDSKKAEKVKAVYKLNNREIAKQAIEAEMGSFLSLRGAGGRGYDAEQINKLLADARKREYAGFTPQEQAKFIQEDDVEYVAAAPEAADAAAPAGEIPKETSPAAGGRRRQTIRQKKLRKTLRKRRQ